MHSRTSTTTTQQLTTEESVSTVLQEVPVNGLRVKKEETNTVIMIHDGNCGYQALSSFMGVDDKTIFDILAT